MLLSLHKKGLSHSTLGLVRDVISGPIGQALDDELISSNPTNSIMKSLKIKKDKRKALDPFEQREVDIFLETCNQHFPEWYTFYLKAFRTGMRLGEILGLQWGDIDFKSKFIHVQRSYKLGKLTSPKNGKTRRVDMSDMLYRSLKNLLTERKKQGLKEGRGCSISYSTGTINQLPKIQFEILLREYWPKLACEK